jgi:hypothetical protein
LRGNGTVLRGGCDGNTSHLNGLLWRHFRHEVALDTPPQILVCHILDTGDEAGLFFLVLLTGFSADPSPSSASGMFAVWNLAFFI